MSSTNNSSAKPEEMTDYKKLEVMDIVRSGALLGVFMVLLLKSIGGRSRGGSLFAIGDVLGTAICGLACYFFPASYLGYQVDGELDFVHGYVTQMCGCLLLGLAWSRYHSLNTRDAYCTASFSVIRLLTSVLMLMAMFHSQFGLTGAKKMTVQHMSFAIFGCGLWLISHVIQLYQYNGEGKRAFRDLEGNRRDVHLLLNGLLLTVVAMHHWGFAEAIGKALIGVDGFEADDIHLYVVKHLAVLLFAGGLQSLAALSYETDEDKKNTLYGNIMFSCLLLPLMVLYQLKNNMYKSFLPVFAGMILLLMNSLLGWRDEPVSSWWPACFRDVKSKTR